MSTLRLGLFVAALILTAPLLRAGEPPTVGSQLKINSSEGGFGGALGAADSFGSSVAVLGDLDGNGAADLAVGAPGATAPAGGAVWILFRGLDGSVESEVRLDATTALLPLGNADAFGRSLAALGDLDQDGNIELAVGADNFGPSTFFGPGAIFVLSLTPAAEVASFVVLSEGQLGVPGPASFTGFGFALAALGDIDENGVTDLAVTDTTDAAGLPVVWLLALDADASVLSATPVRGSDAAFGGMVYPGDRFGAALACLADLDADGHDELAIGAPTTGGLDKGAVWIAFLDAAEVVTTAVRLGENQAGMPGPMEADGWFGASLAAGDIDGNGEADLAVGTPYGDNAGGSTAGAGGVWLLDLDPAAQVQSATHVVEGGASFLGPLGSDDQLGTALALIPDVGSAHTVVAGARGDGGAFVFAPGAVWVLGITFYDPWTDLGAALAGSDGEPELRGTGPLTGGTAGAFLLSHAPPGGFTTLIIGFSTMNAPFKGGTLVPSPDLLFVGLPIDGSGKLNLPFLWPEGLPSGFPLWFQAWHADPAGPKGFSASNGLLGVTP